MSYFDAMRLNYLNAPFANDRERSEYDVHLDQWASYCKSMDRSFFYRTREQVDDVAQLANKALGKFTITLMDGSKKTILLVDTPIECLKVDAIVNAANETLLGGGGVDEAIHQGAGPNLVRECAALNGCEVAEAKMTKGYDLPATYVIHTVAPILDNKGSPQPALLTECYLESIRSAEKRGLQSVAFPCLGCGFYGFPVELSAKTILPVVKEYMEKSSGSVNTIIFSLFNDAQKEAYCTVFSKLTACRLL